MSVLTTARPLSLSSRSSGPLTLLTLLAAALGAVLGLALAPDAGEDTPRAPDPVPRIGLTSGVARVPLPDGWKPLKRLSSLPGLETATAVRGVHSEVALDIRRPESASLLPAGIRASPGGELPAPRLKRLGAHATWRYDLPEMQDGTRLVVIALPTTGGIVTITCAARGDAIARAGVECEDAIGRVQLDGATALPPAPETAARLAVPATIARLNRQRRSARRALAVTRSPRGRSSAANDLARSYAAAAARLRPLAAGDSRRVTATLAALARNHRRLAAAGLRRKTPAARRAGARIARNERRLSSLLAALTKSRTGG